jgi:hypothetical protein
MKRDRTEARLKRAERAFQEWRRRREGGGQSRVPENLWDLACGLRGEVSDSRIYSRLKLNPTSFFRESALRETERHQEKKSSEFLEIPGTLLSASHPVAQGLESVTEMEIIRTDGTRMKVRVPGQSDCLLEAMRQFMTTPSPGAQEC